MFPLNKLYLAVAAAVVLLLGGLWLANARLRADLAEARADVAVYRVANNSFAGKIAEQNAAVERLRADYARRLAQTEAARVAARAQGEVHRAKAQALLSREAGHDDPCRAVETLFNDYWRGLR